MLIPIVLTVVANTGLVICLVYASRNQEILILILLIIAANGALGIWIVGAVRRRRMHDAVRRARILIAEGHASEALRQCLAADSAWGTFDPWTHSPKALVARLSELESIWRDIEEICEGAIGPDGRLLDMPISSVLETLSELKALVSDSENLRVDGQMMKPDPASRYAELWEELARYRASARTTVQRAAEALAAPGSSASPSQGQDGPA